MRDVSIRGNRNTVISSGGGGGGGGFETIAMAVVALIVVALVLQVVAAVAQAIATAVLIIALVCASAAGLAILSGIGWVTYCLVTGRSIRPRAREPRPLPARPVQTISPAGRPELHGGKLGLDQATVEALAAELLRQGRRR